MIESIAHHKAQRYLLIIPAFLPLAGWSLYGYIPVFDGRTFLILHLQFSKALDHVVM